MSTIDWEFPFIAALIAGVLLTMGVLGIASCERRELEDQKLQKICIEAGGIPLRAGERGPTCLRNNLK